MERKSSSETRNFSKKRAPHRVGELVARRDFPGVASAGGCWGVCFSDDQSRIAWCAGDNKIVILPWQPLRHSLDHNTNDYLDPLVIQCHFNTTCLTFIQCSEEAYENGKYSSTCHYDPRLMLATGHGNGRIRFWNAKTGSLLYELTDHKNRVRNLAFCRKSSRLVSGSDDTTIKVWDMNDRGNLVKTLRHHKSKILGLSWSPNGKTLCSVGAKQAAYLWNMELYKVEKTLSGHVNDVNDCAFSPDGALIATASSDTRVMLWHTHSGQRLSCLLHNDPLPGLIYIVGPNEKMVKGVSFCQNGQQVATITSDGQIRFWDIFSGNCLSSVDGLQNCPKEDQMLNCVYSPHGHVLAVGYASGNAAFFSTQTDVPSLRHICRMNVRQQRDDVTQFDALEIPTTLVQYLKYN